MCARPRVGLAYDEATALHAPAAGSAAGAAEHIERPERVTVVWDALRKARIDERCERVVPREVERAEAVAVHSAEHCDALDALSSAPPQMRGAWAGRGELALRSGWLSSGVDMYHNAHTARAARLAAGCVCALVERVVSGGLSSGFAVVRPPGHHACSARMKGFCFLNSVAIAARAAVDRHGLSRVLVVDWDVHHGDGTAAIFEEDPRVMVISLHRYGANFYPGTGAVDDVGAGAGAGYSLNVPWRHEGMSDAEYLCAIDAIVMPVATAFAPELVIVSAGFDAASGDRVGGMALSADGFGAMAARLRTLAGGRLVLALEGGYKPSLAAKGVAACVRVLLDDPSVRPLSAPAQPLSAARLARLARGAQHTLREVIRCQAAHWPCLKDSAAAIQLVPRHCSDGAEADAAEAGGPGEPSDLGLARLLRLHASGEAEEQCSDCGEWRPRADFAANQLKKRRPGERRCKPCASRGGGASDDAPLPPRRRQGRGGTTRRERHSV